MLAVRFAGLLAAYPRHPGPGRHRRSAAPRLHRRVGRTEREWEAKFQAIPEPRLAPRLHARPLRAAAPSRLPGTAPTPSGSRTVRGWGLDARDRDVRRALPDPEERVVELVAPTRFIAAAARAGGPGRIRPRPAGGAAPDLQRLLDRRRRHRAAGVRQLRRARGLRAPRARWASRSRARSSSRGTAARGAASSPRWPRSTARSAASSTPTRATTATTRATSYPKRPFRARDGVQRGSVLDMPLYPGDPLTPGVGATDRRKAARPVRGADAPEDPGAADLVRRRAAAARGDRRDRSAPAGWRGGLPITYHVGPGPARVHLKLRFDWELVPVYDVIARIPGRALARTNGSIRGNHHDAWVNGAEDPISGHGRRNWRRRARYGALLKQGWRPRRTIVYAAWDGEEPTCSARPNGPRPTPTSSRASGGLPQHRRERARVLGRRAARTRWRGS